MGRMVSWEEGTACAKAGASSGEEEEVTSQGIPENEAGELGSGPD